MFSLIETRPEPLRRSRHTILVSLMVHLSAAALLLSLPLLYYRSLPGRDFLTFLPALPVPAPPPAPPPAPRSERARAKRRLVRIAPEALAAPSRIPPSIPAPAVEELPLIESMVGSLGEATGLPGGAPGLPAGTTTGGWRGTGLPSQTPPPPPRRRHSPLRVGAGVQMSKLISKVNPTYPELARRARVEGVVLLETTVGPDGAVEKVRVVKGPTLLRSAAVEAVRQWRYSPTYLNGEPVPVTAMVTVVFKLH